AHQAAAVLEAAGIRRRFSGQFFNEFALKLTNPSAALEAVERKQILDGIALGNDYSELSDALLVSVTEMNRGDEFSRLAAAIGGVRGWEVGGELAQRWSLKLLRRSTGSSRWQACRLFSNFHPMAAAQPTCRRAPPARGAALKSSAWSFAARIFRAFPNLASRRCS